MHRRWAYGVTTVPERAALFERTVASLAAAGFGSPWIFADGIGGPSLTSFPGFTVRSVPARPFGNWLLALWELYLRFPEYDRYAVFQDDFVCVKGLRDYLDACLYPGETGDPGEPRPANTCKGYWSLYTSWSNFQQKPANARGWYEAMHIGREPDTNHVLQSGRGALGLVFNRAAAQVLLSAPSIVQKPTDPIRGWRSLDGAVVTAMNHVGLLEYVHSPSLLQHTGAICTFDKRQGVDGSDPNYPRYEWPAERYAQDFPGEDFDARSLLCSPATP